MRREWRGLVLTSWLRNLRIDFNSIALARYFISQLYRPLARWPVLDFILVSMVASLYAYAAHTDWH